MVYLLTKMVYVLQVLYRSFKCLKVLEIHHCFFFRVFKSLKNNPFSQGALKFFNFLYITNHIISYRVQLRFQWKYLIKFHSVQCLQHINFCNALFKSLSIKKEWSWKKLIWCWKTHENSLIFISSFLYQPWSY